MRLGIIARSDNTGLGNQTRELVKMLNPDKVLLVDSTRFNNNKQHPEWYNSYNVIHSNGIPSTHDVVKFIRNLDAVISCETFYKPDFVQMCRIKGIKTFLQYNYEFLDYLQNKNLQLPDVLIAPSKWHYEDVVNKFGDKSKVVHLPPPTDHEIFTESRVENLSTNSNRILHIAGKAAAKDRNGTNTVIEMLKYAKSDFELVIKTQSELHLDTSDSRLVVDTANVPNSADMYRGFDAMVLPRRYAGLCLPMNEALLSGLPVFMTDIEPNNLVLPKRWLAKSYVVDELMTRTMLDVYQADPQSLANIVDSFMDNKKKKLYQKQEAFDIGYSNFSTDALKQKYFDLINE